MQKYLKALLIAATAIGITPTAVFAQNCQATWSTDHCEIVQQLELQRQTVLVGAFVQDYLKTHPVSDEAIAKEYDNLKATLGTKEYNVRHILVEKESEAKAIAEELKNGGRFDRLATANSKDGGSKERGGDLGWIPVSNIPKAFVKPFGDALMKLSKGQISEPVQSQFGWHIIQLNDVRDLKMPPLNEIKTQITQRVQQQQVKDLIAELRSKEGNNISIPQERIDVRIKIITAQQGQTDSPELRKAVREDLINIELMSQEAIKKGLEKQSETAQQLELQRQTVLMGAFAKDYVKTHPFSETQLQKTQQLQQQGIKNAMNDLRAKAKIEIIDSTETAALVNGIPIPQSRIELRIKMVTAQQGQKDTPELRKEILADLINIEVVAQEMMKQGDFQITQSALVISPAQQSSVTGNKTEAQPATNSVAQRLRELQKLRNEGLITESEFQEKKNKLLEKY